MVRRGCNCTSLSGSSDQRRASCAWQQGAQAMSSERARTACARASSLAVSHACSATARWGGPGGAAAPSLGGKAAACSSSHRPSCPISLRRCTTACERPRACARRSARCTRVASRSTASTCAGRPHRCAAACASSSESCDWPLASSSTRSGLRVGREACGARWRSTSRSSRLIWRNLRTASLPIEPSEPISPMTRSSAAAPGLSGESGRSRPALSAWSLSGVQYRAERSAKVAAKDEALADGGRPGLFPRTRRSSGSILSCCGLAAA
mmetsp:Transcript_41145/g.135590  ORF Transcript_41145/g.135590 Transcript_41145/m.135590 type:complete len:267 (-) Transcript_41145:91-891(-)